MFYSDHDTGAGPKRARHNSPGDEATFGERPPLNADYPDCPFGLRITDLPNGWSVAGHHLQQRYSRKLTDKVPEAVARTIADEVASGRYTRKTIAISHGISTKTVERIMKRGGTYAFAGSR